MDHSTPLTSSTTLQNVGACLLERESVTDLDIDSPFTQEMLGPLFPGCGIFASGGGKLCLTGRGP